MFEKYEIGTCQESNFVGLMPIWREKTRLFTRSGQSIKIGIDKNR